MLVAIPEKKKLHDDRQKEKEDQFYTKQYVENWIKQLQKYRNYQIKRLEKLKNEEKYRISFEQFQQTENSLCLLYHHLAKIE